MKNILYFDIETHSADERWKLPPREFFRLGQWAWNDGPVQLTTDYDEMVAQFDLADIVVGHNIHDFDLSVLYGKDSTEPLTMALDGRVLDTMVHANLVHQAPDRFTMRNGRKVFGESVGNTLMWLGLDNQCYQLGLQGKIGNLKDMAKVYGGFCHIPLNDPLFLEYAIQDVEAVREYARVLMDRTIGRTTWEYAWREQKKAAINAQNARNGFRVDVEKAAARVRELEVQKDELLAKLQREYDFPTEGKSPWASAKGKESIMHILAANGITPESRPDWPRNKPTTKDPKGSLKLGGDELKALTKDTPAEALGENLAILKASRPLAKQALEFTQPDGRVHPSITDLQRSGRSSTTGPSLTTWSARGPKAVEKDYFIASEGCKLLEVDFSNADARIVAAYSGDEEYAKRFEPGADGHEINARIAFGDEVYDRSPEHYRQVSKPLGHGWGYRGGKKALAKGSGLPEDTAQLFIDRMNSTFHKVVAWQAKVTHEGEMRGYVTNHWGRQIPISMYYDEAWDRWKSRAYTQAPAMYGQSGTRELMVDSLVRMAERNIRVVTWLVAQVHDALVFDIPEEELDWASDFIKECMEVTFSPEGGQPIHFPVSSGEPGDTWYTCSHG